MSLPTPILGKELIYTTLSKTEWTLPFRTRFQYKISISNVWLRSEITVQVKFPMVLHRAFIQRGLR